MQFDPKNPSVSQLPQRRQMRVMTSVEDIRAVVAEGQNFWHCGWCGHIEPDSPETNHRCEVMQRMDAHRRQLEAEGATDDPQLRATNRRPGEVSRLRGGLPGGRLTRVSRTQARLKPELARGSRRATPPSGAAGRAQGTRPSRRGGRPMRIRRQRRNAQGLAQVRAALNEATSARTKGQKRRALERA